MIIKFNIFDVDCHPCETKDYPPEQIFKLRNTLSYIKIIIINSTHCSKYLYLPCSTPKMWSFWWLFHSNTPPTIIKESHGSLTFNYYPNIIHQWQILKCLFNQIIKLIINTSNVLSLTDKNHIYRYFISKS